ncbi:MAG: hypothetical protein JWO52_6427 [Gammaproteobacteria bacterium]|nr:hypothetical protein [Gammaproteobacteria bacterium]
MTEDTYLAVGGTDNCQGGVEVFMRRLAAVWPGTGFAALTVLPANTAWKKNATGGLVSAYRWAVALVRTTSCVCRGAFRGRTRVTVWYHYSNAIDLVGVLWLSLLPGLRIFVTPHCSLTWQHLSSPFGRRVALRVLGRATRILVLSEEQREFFKHSGAPVTLIRTLIPPRYGSCLAFLQRPAASFVFVGRVAREKGVPEMVEFISHLCRILPDTRLDLIGPVEPQMHEFIKEAVRREPALHEALRLWGAVSPDCVADELGSHRYLLHLSKVDAFPLAVLEAITAGAVPVVFGLPGTAEIVRRWGGISASAGDVGRLARSILEFESAGCVPLLRSAEAAEYYGSAEVAHELRLTMGESIA